MKKFLGIAAAGLLVFGLAGQAHATFTSGDLIRVVLQENGTSAVEEATDLGNAAQIESGAISLNSNSFSAFGTGTGFTGTNASTLEVAYIAVNSAKSEFWTSGTAGATETNLNYGSFQSSISGPALALYTQYNSNVWQPSSNTSSYFYKMDKNNVASAGSFDYFYSSGAGDGEMALVANGSVTQGIYDWTTPKALSTISPSFTLVTSVDSSGNITTTESTPIPASVLLLGSGLLGLIGIRRKNIFNA